MATSPARCARTSPDLTVRGGIQAVGAGLAALPHPLLAAAPARLAHGGQVPLGGILLRRSPLRAGRAAACVHRQQRPHRTPPVSNTRERAQRGETASSLPPRYCAAGENIVADGGGGTASRPSPRTPPRRARAGATPRALWTHVVGRRERPAAACGCGLGASVWARPCEAGTTGYGSFQPSSTPRASAASRVTPASCSDVVAALKRAQDRSARGAEGRGGAGSAGSGRAVQ